MLPRAGIQGGTYPSKESAVRAIGPLQDLVGATLFSLKNRQVEAVFMVDNEGRKQRAKQTLLITDVAKVSPALVYWNVKQLERQYRLEGGGIVIGWNYTFNTDRDWWILVLQMEPFRGGEALPMMMMECLIYEKGIACSKNKIVRTFRKPAGYVDLELKWEAIRKFTDYKRPSSWPSDDPPDHVWALLKRYPVSTSCDGTPDVSNPRGSGYYAVVVIELAPHSKLYQNFNLRTVIPCKEQLLNRYTSSTVAWPLDALTIAPATSASSSHLGTIPEGVGRRNGLWAPVDDEMSRDADRAEDDDRADSSDERTGIGSEL
jgi:hypothetical protein